MFAKHGIQSNCRNNIGAYQYVPGLPCFIIISYSQELPQIARALQVVSQDYLACQSLDHIDICIYKSPAGGQS